MTEPAEPATSPSMALITPSYGPDLGRCELLVESVQRLTPDLDHVLIIDRHDLRSFRHLESNRTTVVCSEDLLPRGLRRLPTASSIWVALNRRPVRGWIVQQVLKLAVAHHLDHELLVFCDSDTTFIRPFDASDFLVDGAPGLLDVGWTNPDVVLWTRVACEQLGIDPSEVEARNHVGNMVCWRRSNVLGMLDHIESARGRRWSSALLPLRSFSEYMLYGVYVREVLGYRLAGHAPSDVPLVKPSWGLDVSSPAALAEFFAEFHDDTIAIMIHSKDGVPVEHYRAQLHRLWSETS